MTTRRPRGFILPTSLLVLTLLTVMLTAAFVLVSAEYRSTDNAMSGARAQAMAQAGMQSYFATGRSLDSTDTYDSLRFTYSGGYADVVARKMRNIAIGVTPWAIRSTGRTTDPLLSGQITASRVVGQMALLYPGSLPTGAAMVAFNNVIVSGTDWHNPLDGTNWATGCPGSPNGIGLAHSGTYTETSGSSPGNGRISVPEAVLYDSTHIDWATIVAGDFTPDYIGAGNLTQPGNTTWGVGYVVGDLTIPGHWAFPGASGTRFGVLIVTGNVTMADNSHWDGVILAGGRLQGATAGADWIIHGYVVTGLNCAITAGVCSVPANNLYRDSQSSGNWSEVTWSWCWAHIGIASLGIMSPVRGTFMDNWESY